MKKSNKKTLVLSVVAFVLILMSLVSFTYSWIDDIKLVEFQNDNLAQNGAPLKTGTDINSTVNITSKDSGIDLGNMLTNNDLTYEYTENGEKKRHIRYDTSDNSKKPNRETIDKEKGYFYESGDMHLSGCYSDGETFYFPTNANNTSFREGNIDDENVNYISMTMKVSSPYANVDFWFKNEPTIYVHGTNDQISQARYAIIVDGECHVYSSTGTAKTCNSNLNGTQSVAGVRKTTTYTFDHSDNTTENRGKNSNTLFSVNKGSTVNLTVKIWLEGGFDANITAADINLQLVSSWAYKRNIKIVDRTTDNNGSSWIKNKSATLFLTCPSILNDYAKTIYNTDNPDENNWKIISSTNNYELAPFYQLVLDEKEGVNDPDTYTASVPLVFNNEEMILYRCSDAGWNKGSHTGKKGDYDITYWNWWKTTLPNTYKAETYTLYGSSYDEVAAGSDENATYKGYGTWGAVEEIKVYSHYNNVEYATYQAATDKNAGSRLYINDYSDQDTSGEVYTYVMYRGSNDSSTPWRAYIPASSSKIQFVYSLNDVHGTWGYHSWSGENPQRRPLKSTGLYASNSTVYHFAQNYGEDKGWGYWDGADEVYLIKSSFLSSTNITAHAYMYVDSTAKQTYPGEALTRLNDTNNNPVSYTWNGGNYTAEVWKTGSPRVYNKIVFNNGDSDGGGEDQIGKKKTGNLNLFPGCFYQVDGSIWYGSLDDKGRTASEDTGGDSGGEEETGTGDMTGYSTDTKFIFKIDGQPFYAKTNGTDFKVRLNLSSGANWVTVLGGDTSSTNYGNGQSSQHYNTGSAFNGLYLSVGQNSNSAIDAPSAGNYIVKFNYNNGNTNTIYISAIEKEVS